MCSSETPWLFCMWYEYSYSEWHFDIQPGQLLQPDWILAAKNSAPVSGCILYNARFLRVLAFEARRIRYILWVLSNALGFWFHILITLTGIIRVCGSSLGSYCDGSFLVITFLRPIIVAARSKTWSIFARSNTEIVGSNPTKGKYVCVRLFCVCAVLCGGSGLATGWSPV
jgi:hypothetical protein